MSPDLEAAVALFIARKHRQEDPIGHFDTAKRWFPARSERASCCDSIHTPSRSWPYTLLLHCRTAEHLATRYGVPVKEVRAGARAQEGRRPPHIQTRYKIVHVDAEGTYRSLYDPSYTYALNTTYRQAAKKNHEGGYYVHTAVVVVEREVYIKDPRGYNIYRTEYHHVPLKDYFLSGKLSGEVCPGTYAMLRCECWGSHVEYASGKEAFGHMKPVEEVERFTI